MILKCGIVESGGVGIGEVMLYATICNHLPVDTGGRHLCLKRIHLLERYQLIISTCAHQNPGFYLTSLRGFPYADRHESSRHRVAVRPRARVREKSFLPYKIRSTQAATNRPAGPKPASQAQPSRACAARLYR